MLRIIIVLIVLCAFVYMYDCPPEQKREMYLGVVGGGLTAFLVFFIIKQIRESIKNKKK